MNKLIKLASLFRKLAQKESSNLTPSDIVRQAIEKSKDMPHFKNTFLTRNPGAESEGSTFDSPQSAQSLMSAQWEPYNHPDIMSPAIAFRANIPGSFGIVDLHELDPRTPVETALGHKGEDPFLSVLVDKRFIENQLLKTDFTTILLGPDDDDDGHIVWTFFPGPPVMPSTISPNNLEAEVNTVQDAINAGFTYAKVKG